MVVVAHSSVLGFVTNCSRVPRLIIHPSNSKARPVFRAGDASAAWVNHALTSPANHFCARAIPARKGRALHQDVRRGLPWELVIAPRNLDRLDHLGVLWKCLGRAGRQQDRQQR